MDRRKINLKEIGINTRNWTDSAQNRDYWKVLVNMTLNLRDPLVNELVILHVSTSFLLYFSFIIQPSAPYVKIVSNIVLILYCFVILVNSLP